MSVRVRDRVFESVSPGSDLIIKHAVMSAEDTIMLGYRFQNAVVDRYDGLVLLEGPVARDTPGIHLRVPRCGLAGEETQAAARILSRLGFGEEEILYEKLVSKRFCTLPD